MLKKRFLLGMALIALGAASFANAQLVSAYGTFSIPHVSGTRNGGAAPDYTTTNYWAPGLGAGVTFGLIPIGPVRLGFDLRGSTKPGTPGLDTAMGGIKLGLALPLVRIKPYLQASGGYLGTRVAIATGFPAGSTEHDKFAGYEVFGGIDLPLVPLLDLRLIELGGGKGYNIRGVGDTVGNYTIGIFTLSSGIVFHF